MTVLQGLLESGAPFPGCTSVIGGVISRGRREIVCLGRPRPQVPGEPALGFVGQVGEHDLDANLRRRFRFVGLVARVAAWWKSYSSITGRR